MEWGSRIRYMAVSRRNVWEGCVDGTHGTIEEIKTETEISDD